MDLTDIAGLTAQYGAVGATLLLFAKLFFDKHKKQETQLETQIADMKTQFEKREELLHSDIARREEQYKERERILVAENARREDILKKESEKREKIIRDEASKRENALLATIDSFSKTMKEISDALGEMKNATTQMKS